jgi:hypothetical protein
MSKKYKAGKDDFFFQFVAGIDSSLHFMNVYLVLRTTNRDSHMGGPWYNTSVAGPTNLSTVCGVVSRTTDQAKPGGDDDRIAGDQNKDPAFLLFP